MAVIADYVSLEEAVGAIIRGSGEADKEGVEVIEHLLPDIVDRAVALIDDDEIKELDGDSLVVNNGHRFLRTGELHGGADFLQRLIERFVLQDGIEPLDGADADLAVSGDVGGLEPLDAV